MVRIRKYEVNIEELKRTLREHKIKSKLTNKEIATKLDKPLTLVEHWFRNDSSFSIPDQDIWIDLKNLLNIKTNKFDEEILTFEVREGVYDKSNRVYDTNGVAPTLTCANAENERYIVYESEIKNMNEPKLVGGIGEINFGKQFRQGNRVYDANEIAMCLMAQPIGNAGGFSYLYSVEDRGNLNLWKNNLQKYEFNMGKLKVFDVFSGIGALHKSLKKLGVDVEITNISEIDPDAIISYAGVHIEDFKNLEFEYPSDKEMREWLINRGIGYSYEKNKSSIPRMKLEKLKLVYKASVLLNNLGDISKIDYNKIDDFDLMNLSFQCTDLSNAGKQKGMKNEDGTPTRSGLYVYGIKAVREKKPKYIMIENVKGLIQKKFIDDFYSIVNELKDIGYNCYYPTKEDKKGNKVPMCLNAKDFGIPQNRERIYIICIRKDIDDYSFEFPIGRDFGVRLKDLLEDNVDEKYYLSEKIQERFKLSGITDINHNEINTVGTSAPEYRTIGQRDITYGVNGIMSTLVATDYKQPKQILEDNEVLQVRNIVDTGNWNNPQRGRIYSVKGTSPTLNTCSGGGLEPKIVVGEDTKIVCEQRSDEGLRFFKDDCVGTLRTIDACGDKRVIETGAIRGRYNNNGDIEQKLELRKDDVTNTLTKAEKDNVVLENKTRIRKLTPSECWRLMGFDNEDFNNAQNLGISDSQLYKQAGNSIVVNVLYYIFKNLFNKYIINEK